VRIIPEIKLRPERRGGELLREMDLNKGGWANKESCAPAMGVQDETPKLSDMGISFNQSSRWQAMAKLPEEKFERYLTEKIKG
jgi:hypothetical protein